MEEQTKEVLEILPERSQNGRDIGPRYEAIACLTENNFPQERIAKALNVTRKTISTVQNKVMKKYDLTSPKFVKLAAHAVKRTLEGQSVGDADAPKAGNVLQAASMVYDRYQPIKQALGEGQSISFTQINLSISNGTDPDIIDLQTTNPKA